MLIKRDGTYLRHAEEDINDILDSGKMVAISGAHGCGKTTLAKKIAKERGLEFVSLDDPATYKQARRNPKGLLESLDSTGAVIDEIQKAHVLGEYLVEHLKPHPNKFMVTSSIRELTRPFIDFGGKKRRVELSPFSQSEIEGASSPGGFLDDTLKGMLSEDQPCEKPVDLWSRIWRGGYPRSVLAQSSEESWLWRKNYEHLLKNIYMKETFKIRSHDKFKKFLLYLAENYGDWFQPSTIARKLNTKTRTITHWMFCLREAYIIDWSHNNSMTIPRLSDPRAGDKVHFLDSGLLASLRGWSSLDTIIHPENRLALLRSFVYGELNKLIIHWGGFRHLDSYEHLGGAKVDFVFHVGSRIVGVDVKASSSLKSSDFEGLRSLKKEVDENPELDYELIYGVVFYAGEEVHCSDEGFYGFPVGRLWAASQETSKELPILKEAAMA